MTEIYACATHGVLSGPAIDRIGESALRELVLTDTVPLPPGKRIPKITTLSIAPLIGEAIKRIHRGESVGALFSSEVEFTQEMLLWEDGVARKLDIRDGARPRRRRARPADGKDGPKDGPSSEGGGPDTDAGRAGRAAGGPQGEEGGPSEDRPAAWLRELASTEPRRGPMSLQLHRPDERGVLKPRARPGARLPRPAALAALGARAPRPGRLPAFKNPEMRPTSRVIAVMFWVGLAVATFMLLVARLRNRSLAVPGDLSRPRLRSRGGSPLGRGPPRA